MSKELAIIYGILNKIDSLITAINDNYDKIPPNKYENADELIRMLNSIWIAGMDAGKEYDERTETFFKALAEQ